MPPPPHTAVSLAAYIVLAYEVLAHGKRFMVFLLLMVSHSWFIFRLSVTQKDNVIRPDRMVLSSRGPLMTGWGTMESRADESHLAHMTSSPWSRYTAAREEASDYNVGCRQGCGVGVEARVGVGRSRLLWPEMESELESAKVFDSAVRCRRPTIIRQSSLATSKSLATNDDN